MSMDSFENTHVRAYWNPDLQCVVLDSKDASHGDGVRQGISHALAMLQRHGATKVMADRRLLQMLAGVRPATRANAASTQGAEPSNEDVADYLHAVGR